MILALRTGEELPSFGPSLIRRRPGSQGFISCCDSWRIFRNGDIVSRDASLPRAQRCGKGSTCWDG